jgi:protocatechuate 3,4-dioxygenase alpha subunit
VTLLRTPSQTVGPFFTIGLAPRGQNEVVADGDVRLIGRVTDVNGEPVDDALLELYQPEGWARCGTDADGRFEFRTVKPASGDGSAPHIDVLVFARGLLRHVGTRIYFPDETEANASDPVLSTLEPDARATLVAVQEDGALRFDLRLRGERETVFFAV